MNMLASRASRALRVGIVVVMSVAAQGCQTTSAPTSSGAAETALQSKARNWNSSTYQTYRQAIAHDEAGNFEEAIALYSTVIESDEKRLAWSARINRAFLYKFSGRAQESIADFNAYIDLERKARRQVDAEIWANLAHAYYQTDQRAKAFPCLEEALKQVRAEKKDDGQGFLLAAIADLYALVGEQDKAIDLLSDVIDRLGRHPWVFGALESRAAAYIRSNDMGRALRDLDRVVDFSEAVIANEKAPYARDASQRSYTNAMEAYKLRAYVKAHAKDRDGAIADLFKARDRASHLTNPLIARRILQSIRRYRKEKDASPSVTYENFGVAKRMTDWTYKIRFQKTIERNGPDSAVDV